MNLSAQLPKIIAAAGFFVCLAASFGPPKIGEDRRIASVQADFDHLTRQFEEYRSRSGDIPTTQEGFDALIKRPEDASAQWTQGLQALPWDPWGNRYHYRKSIRNGIEVPEVLSAGKDSLIGTEDDLSSLER